jgi:hypothetical protein
MQQEEYRDPGKLHYHYDREERMHSLSPSIRERMEKSDSPKKGGLKKPLFRRNRSLMILLLDIIIILFLYFIILPLLGIRGGPSVEQIQDYTFELNGFVFEEKSLLSLNIERVAVSEKKEDGSEEGKTITVVFSVEGTEKTVEAIDVLPEEEGASRIIRASIPYNGEEKKAFAEISFADESAVVETKLRPEVE